MQRRKPQEERLESPWSASLRRIGDHIQKRKFPRALAEANELLSQPDLSDHKRSRVLALVADSEFKRGHFARASQIHLQAASKNLDHATLWLRPHIGNVQALLKEPQVDQAVLMARHAVALAETKMSDFNGRVRSAHQDLESTSVVVSPPLPPRVSVVATRMGYLFLQEGEPEAAKEFFEKAIQSTKGGSNRARQGLAQIALAKGDFAEVAQISAEAIRKGHFRAKTLSAWSTLIAARRQLGCWRISDRLIKGLDSAPAELRARTILTIVTELRKHDMRQWRKVAEEWLEKEGPAHPQYETDIRKLFLASSKLEMGNMPGKREAAEQLLNMPELGINDWVVGAKEYVRAGLLEGIPIDLDRLLEDASDRYGEDILPLAAHRLALSCISAKRPDLARPLLQAGIQQCKTGSPQWGKSFWALARMERDLGNHIEAAQAFRRLFESPGVPARVCLQAQLRWAQELIESGDSKAFWEAHSLMMQTLKTIQNPDILMNFARQLSFGPPELRQWGNDLFLQGETLALARFNEATHPAAAMDILYKLTRRQVVDFNRSVRALELWDSFDAQKRDWLWSTTSIFWGYMGYLFRAYLRVKDTAEGERFANALLNDPASPASGLPFIGIPYARYLIDQGRIEEGLMICQRMADGAPRHSLCAWAWYWLALAALRRGNTEKTKEYAHNIRTAQGMQPGTLDEWWLDARALLLLVDLDSSRIDMQTVAYPPELVDKQRIQISNDLEGLPE